MSSPDRPQPATAELATTIAGLLLGNATTDQHTSAPDREETTALMQAMSRLLLGTPLRSDGKLTIKTLAVEAGLRRNKLTHKHTGIKDLFYALVKAHHAQPAIVVGLHTDNDRLRTTVTELRQTNHEQSEMIKRFARVVHVLEIENQQLREYVTAPRTASGHANLRFLHPPAPDNTQPGEHDTVTRR